MEADVAIHTPAEMWSSMSEATTGGASRASGPAHYFYSSSGTRSGREAKPDGRRGEEGVEAENRWRRMKPSRSYDNELEISIAKESERRDISRSNISKDDLSLHPRALSTSSSPKVPIPTHATHTADPEDRKAKVKMDIEGKNTCRSKERGRRRQQQGKDIKWSGSKMPTHASQQGDTATVARRADSSSSNIMPGENIPVEFYVKERQPAMQATPTTGKKTAATHPTTLALDEPSAPMVILEVKDGPTLFYKPSRHMTSDSRDGNVSDVWHYGARHGGGPALGAGEAPAENFEDDLLSHDPTWPGQEAAGESPSSICSELYSHPCLSHDEILVGPRRTAESDEELFIYEDAAPQLRFYDQHNGATSQTLKSKCSEDNTKVVGVKREDTELSESQPVTATLDVEGLRPSSPSPPISDSGSPIQDASGSHSGNVSLAEPTCLAVDPMGFRNASILMQQMAGVRHDDIVVGPRKGPPVTPTRSRRTPDSVVESVRVRSSAVSEAATELQAVCASGAVPSQTTECQRTFTGERSVSTNPSSARGQNGQSSIVGTPSSEISATVPASAVATVPISSNGAKKSESADTIDPPMSPVVRAEVTVTPDSESKRWRPKEKKSGVQRARRGRKKEQNISTESGYMTDIAKHDLPASGQREVLSQTESPTTFLSELDPNEKPISLSTNSSPAKQNQPHAYSHVSAKSKSTNSSPLRKSDGVGYTRQNALSNIPVAISHDPHPPKKMASRLPVAAFRHDGRQMQKDSALASSTKEVPVLDSVQSETVPPVGVSPSPFSTTSSNMTDRWPKVPELDQSESRKQPLMQSPPHSPSPLPDVHASRHGNLQSSQQHDLSANSFPSEEAKNTTSVDMDKVTVSPKHQEVSTTSTIPSSSFDPRSSLLTGKGELPVACRICPDTGSSVKPRFHRSAEHLPGHSQLSVFCSTDNVQCLQGTTGASGGSASPWTSSATKGLSSQLLPKTAVDSGVRSDTTAATAAAAGLLKKSPQARVHEKDRAILRRGSDRTGLVVRRGLERAIPVGRHDPSVEDLKKATSLKELCQSVASLLNIDNERAAEMLTTSLSQRQDLVEGLDADAILDYLTHHGVLDPSILSGLGKTQRNSAILKHVEEHGNTAVALFINALRQSGQLHLASSLDTEQRIKPVSGDGYFGKNRHKGEITIRFEVDAVKVWAPREPRTDHPINTSLLATPTRHTEGGDVGSVLEEEEDFVKSRSCWCFCFSRKSKSSKSATSKKSVDKRGIPDGSPKTEPISIPSEIQEDNPEWGLVDKTDPYVKPHRTKSKEKGTKSKGTKDQNSSSTSFKEKKGKKSKTSKSKLETSGIAEVPQNQEHPLPVEQAEGLTTVPTIEFRTGRGTIVTEGQPLQDRPGPSGQETDHQQERSNGMGKTLSPKPQSLRGPKLDKESLEPIIMEYDPKLELVKLRAGPEELASPTRQSGNIGIMCEQWKSSGKFFLQKSGQLCKKLVQELQTDIIKYFEQDRGTLVLDVVSEGPAIIVFNICMMHTQVEQLQQEAVNGNLVSKIQDMFFPRVDVAMFDIRAVKFKAILDELELKTALSELS